MHRGLVGDRVLSYLFDYLVLCRLKLLVGDTC